MPVVPWGPYYNDAVDGILRARAPDFERGHYLGTDSTGRDILARLVYGFRTAMLFAIAFTVLTYLIGVGIGCAMGYFGGVFDLLFQRIIEIWSNVPFLYMVIIIFSVIPATFSVGARIGILLMIMVLFSWTGLTYYMRTATYKERERDYAAAAQVLGAGTSRIIFRHILPNTVATMVTFVPFTVVGAITAITALDFLGFGLPPPTPSIGEMLKQGTANLTTAPWIVTSAFAALVIILLLVTFIGEAVREAFDPAASPCTSNREPLCPTACRTWLDHPLITARVVGCGGAEAPDTEALEQRRPAAQAAMEAHYRQPAQPAARRCARRSNAAR
jgi:microcin C transport system permease protein